MRETGPEDRRRRRSAVVLAAVAVFLVALGVRIAYQASYRANVGLDMSELPEVDQKVFRTTAAQIAAGDILLREPVRPYHWWYERIAPAERFAAWYGPGTFHQSPLYSYGLAACFRLFGERTDIVLRLQAVLGALTAVLVLLIAVRFMPLWAATGSGLAMALYAPAVMFDSVLLRAGLVTLLAAGLLLALVRLQEDPGRRRLWAVAGFVFGLSILAKPNIFLFFPVAVIWMGLIARRARVEHPVRCFAIFLIAFAAPLLPAAARNIAVGAPITSLTTRGPYAFVNGNASASTGVGWFAEETQKELLDGQAREILNRTEAGLLDTVLATVATHRDDPLGFVTLQLRKAAALFNAHEVPNNVRFHVLERMVPLLGWLPAYWLVAPLAAVGLLLALRRREMWVLLLFVIVYSTATILFYVIGRFRLPMVPVVMVLAGLGATGLVDAVRRRHWAGIVAGVAVIAATAFLVRPSEAPPSRVLAKVIIGDLHVAMGHEGRAVELYAEALRDQRGGTPADRVVAASRLAMLRVAQKGSLIEMVSEARNMLRGDLEAHDRALVHMLIGNAMQESGNYQSARAELLESLRFAPDLIEAKLSMAWLKLREGDAAGAEADARAILANEPEHTRTLLFLGEMLLQQDRRGEAQPFLWQAAEHAGADQPARERAQGLLSGEVIAGS